MTAEKPHEEVVFTARHHWVNLAPALTSVAMMGLGLLFLVYVAGRYMTEIERYLPLAIVGFLILLIALLMGLILVVALWVFKQNKLVVTREHVIQVNQQGLFHRTESRLNLDDVQDVSAAKKGLFATIFGYGDVMIETAGEQKNFKFAQTSDPYAISERIMELRREYEARKSNET